MSPYSDFTDSYLSDDRFQRCTSCEQVTDRVKWVESARCPCCEALIYDAIGQDESERLYTNERGILDVSGNILVKLGRKHVGVFFY